MDMVELEPGLSLREQSERLLRVSLSSADQLKEWLEKSGRKWLVFDALELVDALPFPDGVDTLIQLIACYRDYRSTLFSGRTEKYTEPTLGKVLDRPLCKGETLEVEELDRAIRYLIRQITDRNPKWTLNDAPL